MERKPKKRDYSNFLKYVEEDKNETSSFAKTLFILVCIILGLFALFLFTLNDKETVEQLFGKDTFISQKLIQFIESKSHRRRMEFAIPFMPRRQNILLLGVDSNGSDTDPWRGTRSDTIVLLNIDPQTRSVNAISIPRDSKVFLAGDYGIQKINAAHALGGVNLTKQTVEEALGVHVDKYIVVSDGAVEKLVDTLGGVPTYVEKKMKYDDFSGHLHVHLNKGLHVLNGKEAVGYLRFRHDGLGDIGRTQRQQWFLRGLLEKIQTPQAIPKIPQMINIATTYVKTDLSLYEMSQYAALAKSFDINKIQVATLPGRPNLKGSISYWILDPAKTQEVVNRLIYRDNPPEIGNKPVAAGIMYSPSKKTEAEEIKTQFENMGYEVTFKQREHLPHEQFIANSDYITPDFFNKLKKKVTSIKNLQFVFDANKNYCYDCDFVVIVSDQ